MALNSSSYRLNLPSQWTIGMSHHPQLYLFFIYKLPTRILCYSNTEQSKSLFQFIYQAKNIPVLYLPMLIYSEHLPISTKFMDTNMESVRLYNFFHGISSLRLSLLQCHSLLLIQNDISMYYTYKGAMLSFSLLANLNTAIEASI